jgi:catechol 2,3-dioxygenase-like lactoylglutathione lyase family enzyme
MNRRQFHQTITAMLPAAALARAQQSRAQDFGQSTTKGRANMQVVARLVMFSMAVSDMPKAKAFYVDKLGLKVVSDNRRDDDHWWVGLTPLEGGAAITLTTARENMQPGTTKVYFATADVAAAHNELSAKGVKVNEVKTDLYGPGSGVKWFLLEDPDGNQVLLVQA